MSKKPAVTEDVCRDADLFSGKGAACGSTERVRKLNEAFHATKPGVCLNQARAFTEVYKNEASAPPLLKKAKAVARSLDTLVPCILDGELIVGFAGNKPRTQQIHPEVETWWIESEGGLGSLSKRKYNPFFVEPQDVREFEEEIAPFWRDRDLFAQWKASAPAWLVERCIGTGFAESSFPLSMYGSHLTLDWPEILELGVNTYKKYAEERLTALNPLDQSDYGKEHYYRAVIMELEAIEGFARRYASRANELAEHEANPQRKAELLKIAEICGQVPHGPARTFHEALQSIWFIYCAFHQDGTGPLLGLGRFDQYMYPYYRRDIDAGTMTKESAQELLECMYIKMSNTSFFSDSQTSKWFAGTAVFQNLLVGGTDRYGNDTTNELSFLCIDALIQSRTIQPSMCVRTHTGTPDSLRMKTVELIKAGMGHPSIYNDETSKQTMISMGYSISDSNEYIATGCMEIGKQGYYIWTPAAVINLAICVDLAFTNGVKRPNVGGGMTGKQLSVATGDPRSFKTYEEFESAVLTHLKTQMDYEYQAVTIMVEMYQNIPLVMQSIFSKSGLERGLPTHGGGQYSSSCPGYSCQGIPDIGNSLAAVKKLVFDDKVITMDKLCEALDNNFEGYEDIRQMCLNAPKYGNDDDYVDRIEQRVLDYMANYTKTLPGLLAKRDPDKATAHIRHQTGTALAPVSGGVVFGLNTGALPSGRKAMECLGDSSGPAAGTDVNGPTAALKSVAKMPHDRLHGTITNMYVDLDSIKEVSGMHRLADMIQSYFDQGGAHVQFNVMDKDTLRAAKKNPEEYPKLIVRVAGYSAYFVELDAPLQDDIIARTQHKV